MATVKLLAPIVIVPADPDTIANVALLPAIEKSNIPPALIMLRNDVEGSVAPGAKAKVVPKLLIWAT